MTPPEAALWLRLRLRKPDRPTFRRQHAVGHYCASLHLAIEINGQIHETGDNPGHDARRTAWLNGQGIKVIRFPAADVLRDADEIAEAIWLMVRRRVRGDV